MQRVDSQISLPMKIIHVSDLHSIHPPKVPDDIDIIVNSGDWMPNAPTDSIYADLACQERWLEDNAEQIKNWTNNKLILFTEGNHDRFNVQKILPKLGIRIINITNQLYIHHSGLSFYGFPFIPFIEGWWNHERELPEMVKEFDLMLECIKDAGLDQIDVLVAHCPPYGILDKNREGSSIGNRVLINRIDYCDFMPLHILCGHVHENAGVVSYNQITISNAACTQHILEVQT